MTLVDATRAELAKLLGRPAVWILTAILVGLILLLGYVALWLVATQVPADELQGGATPDLILEGATPSHVPAQVLGLSSVIGGAVALILGALAVGSEFGWRTLGTVAVQRPSRTTLALGRALALVIASAGLTAAAFVAALAGSALVVALEPVDTTAPTAATMIGGFVATVLVLAVLSAVGACLAMLTRGTGIAIGVGLLALLVVPLLGALPLGQAGEVLRGAFVSTNVDALAVAVLPDDSAQTALVSADVPVVQAVAVLLGYLVAAVGVTVAVFARRDLT